MNKSIRSSSAGYFLVTIKPGSSAKLLTTNTERAYIVSQLQDVLSTRSILEEPDAYKRLASHIDLLVFSLLPQSIQMVLFAISSESATNLADTLSKRLANFQSEWQYGRTSYIKFDTPSIYVRKLTGPYDALETSIQLHLAHQDWEYDRYSSISFFLHDRRGSWMRLWRLSQLYDNDPSKYYQLVTAQLNQSAR